MDRINPHDIFESKDFKLWLLRLESLLCRKELLEITEESTLETEYRLSSPAARKDEKFKEFRKTDAKAKSYIIEHVSQEVLSRIQCCVTAHELV